MCGCAGVALGCRLQGDANIPGVLPHDAAVCQLQAVPLPRCPLPACCGSQAGRGSCRPVCHHAGRSAFSQLQTCCRLRLEHNFPGLVCLNCFVKAQCPAMSCLKPGLKLDCCISYMVERGSSVRAGFGGGAGRPASSTWRCWRGGPSRGQCSGGAAASNPASQNEGAPGSGEATRLALYADSVVHHFSFAFSIPIREE